MVFKPGDERASDFFPFVPFDKPFDKAQESLRANGILESVRGEASTGSALKASRTLS